MNSKEGSINISVAVFVLILAGVLGYFAIHKKASSPLKFSPPPPSPASSSSNPEPSSQKVLSPRDKRSCEAVGGRWGPLGLAQIEKCNVPTGDSDRECRSGSECKSGVCYAENNISSGLKASGKCYGWKETVGTCFNRVEGGIVQGILCVD